MQYSIHAVIRLPLSDEHLNEASPKGSKSENHGCTRTGNICNHESLFLFDYSSDGCFFLDRGWAVLCRIDNLNYAQGG